MIRSGRDPGAGPNIRDGLMGPSLWARPATMIPAPHRPRPHGEGRPAARTSIPQSLLIIVGSGPQTTALSPREGRYGGRCRSTRRHRRAAPKEGTTIAIPPGAATNDGVFPGVPMRFSLSSLARLAIGTILVSAAAAIGLARLAPPHEGWRMLGPSRYVNVNSFYLDPCRRGSSWLDREGGAMRDVPFGDEELLEYASSSPWRDELGRTQVIGRWSWGFKSEATDRAYGLARITFPDGEVLDHIETDVVPVSSPCWYPGTGARVLFAAGDGKLYQCNFEPGDDGAAGSDRHVERPRPIAWNCEFPGGEGLYLAEPHWPTDPNFSRILFVSLRTSRRIRGEMESTPAQIWWLRLSEDGDSIEEAGRLFNPPASQPEANERCPTVGRTPDGRPLLAYFRKEGMQRANLYLIDIEFGPGMRHPGPVPGVGTKIADACLPSPPVFSGDGRWITIIQADGGSNRVVRRVRADLRGETVMAAASR